MRPTRRAFALLMLAMGEGLLLGAAARLTMRIVAIEAGVEPGFSLGGSLEVVLFGVMIGTPIALGFGLTRQRVPLARPWAGMLCGLALFITLASFQPPSAQSALAATPDTPLVTAVSFGTLFLGWGLVLELVWGVLRGRLDGSGGGTMS